MKKVNTLVVEDDSIFAARLESMLGDIVGKIHRAKSSLDARDLVKSVKPSIIFMDNWLPGLNGSQLIQEFKQLLPDVYIVMMSTFSDVNEIAECIQNGADDILSKENFDSRSLDTVLTKLKKNKKSFDWGWLIPDVFKALPSAHNHIAILEDDELFSFHLKWKLSSAKENIVNSFGTKKEFFDFYTSKFPDILFLDYYLPDGVGKELIKEVKAKMPKTKIIIISSQEDIDVAIDMKRKGADSYISKSKNWQEQVANAMEELLV